MTVSLEISGKSAFPLCLGGNVFGWTASEEESFAVLDAYAAVGGNFVDTSDSYSAFAPGNSGGESETIIGRWMRSRGTRDSVIVATKVGRHPGFRGLAPDTIRGAADASLRRLDTDHIDLYFTHFDDESVPVEDIITALDALVTAGKVRRIAVSNISPARLAASLEFSDREGLAKYVAIQPQYNMVSRDTYEGALRDLAVRHGLACVPYYALAAGFLTGKYRPGGPAVDSPRAPRAGALLESPRGLKVLEALDAVAAAHSAEPATVAIAWLLAQPTVAAPIASARDLAQLPPLLALPGLHLTPEDLTLLTDATT